MRIRRRCASRNATFQRGFTLTEIIIVLVIAGLMIALALPRMDTSRYKADAVAQVVRTTLQTASRAAITRQHDVIVRFDTLGERLEITWDSNNDGVAQSTERVIYQGLGTGVLFADPTIRGLSGSTITSAVTGPAIAVTFGLPSVTFHRDGSVSSDAEIYVSIAARGPTLYRAITLTQSTGRVEWYRLNGSTNSWQLAGL
jgi:prepilin-type N-terminal cleavage/methylation domain-containing protein